MDHKQISLGGIKCTEVVRFFNFPSAFHRFCFADRNWCQTSKIFQPMKGFEITFVTKFVRLSFHVGMYRWSECLFSLTRSKPLYQSNLKLSRHDWSFVYDSPCEWIGFELQLSQFLLHSIMWWRWSLWETVSNPSSSFTRCFWLDSFVHLIAVVLFYWYEAFQTLRKRADKPWQQQEALVLKASAFLITNRCS